MSETPKCDSALTRLAGHLDQADLDRYLAAIDANQIDLSIRFRHHLFTTQATWPTPTSGELRAALHLAGLRLVPIDAKP